MQLDTEKTMVIACNVLREQIQSLGEMPYSFTYLEEGLHRSTKNLQEQLQKAIDQYREYSVLLLGYGMCGRAVIGIHAAPHQKMIIPKIDDCIGLSMGSRANYYKEFYQNPGTYYFTRGFIKVGEDPLQDYYKCAAKHGEKRAVRAAKASLKNYRRTLLIKTGDQDLEHNRQYVKQFASFFDLCYEEMDGSPNYLKKFLFGPWDEDFVVVEGGAAFSDELFQNRFSV